MIRLTAHFSGTVQGVGFRFTTRQVVSQFAVTGFVRNLSDGRVELVVEGDEHETTAVIDAVLERMNEFVESVDRRPSPATGEFKGFEIRR